MNIAKLFSRLTLLVEWDDEVKQNLKPQYQGVTQARVRIGLFNFLRWLGCVQPRRKHPSLLSSMLDYYYLLERLSDGHELRLKINETRNWLGSEMLTEVSELMGVGLSVSVISQLYEVQQSTIHKIIGINSRRPDWMCLLCNGTSLLVEAKGSTNTETWKKQLKAAVNQKNSAEADVKVAAATVLNENAVSKMKIIDPPTSNDDIRNEQWKHIYRANHYASVFSFWGDDVLSLYFEKMSKRLSRTIGKVELMDKKQMYEELKYNNRMIVVNNSSYAGHLYGSEDGRFFYIGVNSQLLSYQGFMEFRESAEELMLERYDNHYYVCPDGVMFVDVQNYNAFLEEHHLESKDLNLDNIVLRDLDTIRGNSFKRYVKYLLTKCYDDVEMTAGNVFTVKQGNRIKRFVVYHARHNMFYPTEKQIGKIFEMVEQYKGVLVTNINMDGWWDTIPCVDRNDLQVIANTYAEVDVLRSIFERQYR